MLLLLLLLVLLLLLLLLLLMMMMLFLFFARKSFEILFKAVEAGAANQPVWLERLESWTSGTTFMGSNL